MHKSERIALIMPVGPDIALLEQTLLHYLSLGIRKILLSVHVHGDNGEQHLSKVSAIAERYHAQVADMHTTSGIDSAKRYQRLIQRHCEPDDWVVYADVDEFIQFPAPVSDIAEFCDANGFDYIQGYFLDRLAADGSFPELTEQSVWDQFPVGIRLTREVCQGNEHKITLARAGISVANGHHYARHGTPCPQEQCMSIVHHFKWDGSIIERCIKMKAVNEDNGLPWSHEYQRFISYYEQNNSHIDLSDPGLEAYWPSYKRSYIERYQNRTAPWEIDSDPNFFVPVLKDSVYCEQINAEKYLLKNETLGSHVEVDPISYYIFEQLNGNETIHELSNRLATAFASNWWQIESDTQTILRGLCHSGMLSFNPANQPEHTPDIFADAVFDDKPWALYIIWSYPQVSETYIENEIQAMQQDYHVFVAARYPADASTCLHVPYRVTATQEEILSLIHALKPAVLHTHWLDNIQLVSGLSLQTQTPFTVRAHSFDIEKINRDNLQMYQPELANYWREIINHELCLGVLTFPYSLRYYEDIGVSQAKIHACFPVIDYDLFYDTSPNRSAVMNTGACHPKKSMESFVNLALIHPDKEFNLYPVGYHTQTVIHYNEVKDRPVHIHEYVQPEQMPARYKQNNWLVYTGDIALKTVGWPMAIAEAQAAGLGICIPDIRPEMKDYLGGAGFTYRTIEEAAEIIAQPYPESMRKAGFEQAKKSDISSHKHLLTKLWEKA